MFTSKKTSTCSEGGHDFTEAQGVGVPQGHVVFVCSKCGAWNSVCAEDIKLAAEHGYKLNKGRYEKA